MRKTLLLLVLLAEPLVTGCSLADWAFALFGDAYSAGDHSNAGRQAGYDTRVRATSEPPRIPGTDTQPF